MTCWDCHYGFNKELFHSETGTPFGHLYSHTHGWTHITEEKHSTLLLSVYPPCHSSSSEPASICFFNEQWETIPNRKFCVSDQIVLLKSCAFSGGLGSRGVINCSSNVWHAVYRYALLHYLSLYIDIHPQVNKIIWLFRFSLRIKAIIRTVRDQTKLRIYIYIYTFFCLSLPFKSTTFACSHKRCTVT